MALLQGGGGGGVREREKLRRLREIAGDLQKLVENLREIAVP